MTHRHSHKEFSFETLNEFSYMLEATNSVSNEIAKCRNEQLVDEAVGDHKSCSLIRVKNGLTPLVFL